jgi:hypothetical protein
MRKSSRWRVLLSIVLFATPATTDAQQAPGADRAPVRSGVRDFDLHIGTWRTQLRLLVSPLSATPEWAEYTGTSVVTKVWDGDANLVELDATGARGRIRALSLRLYNPATGQWSLNFSNARAGTMATPSIGGFVNGRGEFYSHEPVDGRMAWVRFVISPLTADSIRFEQSVSLDGGRSWIPNWIAIDTRLSDAARR